MSVTRLYYTDLNGKRRLMNTIDSSSLFFGFKAPKDLHLIENRILCANMIKDGWITNGGLQGTWEIEEGKRDPIFFSKMTENIMRGVKDEELSYSHINDL